MLSNRSWRSSRNVHVKNDGQLKLKVKFKSNQKGIPIAGEIFSTADGISKITEYSILEMSLPGSRNEAIHTCAEGISIHIHAEGIR